MPKRTSENLRQCEKNLLEKLPPLFRQDDSTPLGDREGWQELGAYLEWQLLPLTLRLAPAWPDQWVWCDGVEFFHYQIEQPNVLRALACSWWLPTDTDAWDAGITAGIEHNELLEIEIRWFESESEPYTDYSIKIWADNLCHHLTPGNITVAPSCSDPLSTANLEQLLAAIKRPTFSLGRRSSVAFLLGGFGARGMALLDGLLSDPDVEVRRAATNSLERRGFAAQFAMPLMTKALQDPDPYVQFSTANALWERLKQDDAFLPLLLQSTPLFLRMFGHEPQVHRPWYLNKILAYLIPKQTHVAEAMVAALADENQRLRAALLLLAINAPTPDMLRHYQAAPPSGNMRWRGVAAFSLWRFGVDQGQAFIELTEDNAVLQDPYLVLEWLNFNNTPSIKLIPHNDLILALSSLLLKNNTHLSLWCAAAQVLAKTYTRGVDTDSQRLLQTWVPKLLQHLNGNDERIQRHALNALGAIGADAKAAIPAMLEIVYNPDLDGHLRGAAAEALATIGPDAKIAVPLFNFLRRQKEYSLCSQALPLLKPPIRPVTPAVLFCPMLQQPAHKRPNRCRLSRRPALGSPRWPAPPTHPRLGRRRFCSRGLHHRDSGANTPMPMGRGFCLARLSPVTENFRVG